MHGYAVKCDVAPSNTIRNPKVFIFKLCRFQAWSRKTRSPNSSARSPLTRDLSGLGFTELQRKHIFTTRWWKSYFSKNVLVSRPLLELRGRHVVVIQMKVPQVVLCPLTRVPGGPFLLRTGAAGGGLGGTKGKICSSSASRSRFSLAGSFLDAGPTSGLSSSSSSSCMSGAWAGYAGFSLSHGKGYMSPWVTRSLTQLGRWLIRKIRQVQHNVSHCGVLSWRRIQTKSWTCNFVSFWIQFTGHTQVFHLRER